jgi:hypothetical protein
VAGVHDVVVVGKGKKPSPTPTPAALGEPTNEVMAWLIASHRVGCNTGMVGISQASSDAAQFIDPDLSCRMKTSEKSGLAS